MCYIYIDITPMLLFYSPQNDHILKFLASKHQVSRGIVIYKLK